jgi:predicted RNA-binding protein
VANYIEQQPMFFEGTVKEIDAKKGTMTLRHLGLDKTFEIAPGCPVDLQNNRSGKLADVETGNLVTVTYETPRRGMVAHRIVQDDQIFTGQVTAIDLADRSIKANDMLVNKAFIVPADCAIVLNGTKNAQLRDAKLGDILQFDYTDDNGINIVNRITSGTETEPGLTASSGSQPEFPTPNGSSGY